MTKCEWGVRCFAWKEGFGAASQRPDVSGSDGQRLGQPVGQPRADTSDLLDGYSRGSQERVSLQHRRPSYLVSAAGLAARLPGPAWRPGPPGGPEPGHLDQRPEG